MCPFWDYQNKRCRVSPSDSQCYNNDSEQQAYGCVDDYRYKSYCANYAAYQRGDYKVWR
ncbi:MAG: hypothetical protein FWC26_00430 [Fibromonadales bacterium]|nr:hypothetical protein [Fibromonadales bacterium]